MSTDGRVLLQHAFLLHRKPYRDTSLLVEAFSREYGKIGLVAKGARGRRSAHQAMLQPFQPLLLSWSGRGDLQTLTALEPDGQPQRVTGDALIGGFYLNELLMRLLPRHDPHPGLYTTYLETLNRLLSQGNIGWTLRLFERALLQELGYGLQLTHDADSGLSLVPNEYYCYHPEHGPQRRGHHAVDCLAVRGATLLALHAGDEPGPNEQREAKRLMRAILQRYLGNRPLASRELFRARYTQGTSDKPHKE